ncbi:TetR/AcrR family transcriptional regulator [Streptomyces cinereospinus]|uniref:TetR/AcrR family transcriptional regulator n=1 Tax=Streptomyces cinereospinus TaxID=285561 RepID=A0ABV5N792_9ACTN
MTTRTSPKDKRLELGERSKETILDVATRLMSARGYEGTSISAIAKESGLAASSIYWHFSSKAGVLTAVMDRGNARFYADAPRLEFGPETSHLERIAQTLQHGMRALEQNPDFVRLQVILMLNSPAGAVNEAVLSMRTQAREGIRAALAQAFGDLGPDRSEAVAAGLADFVAAGFEGIFLARESAPGATQCLLRRLARATVTLAEGMLSPDSASSDSAPQ